MTIILTIFATLVFVILWPVCINIYQVGERPYYAARWAIILWVCTLGAGLFAAALWTGGYLHVGCIP